MHFHPGVLRGNLDEPRVLLWVKAESFIVGALQFSLHCLRKISNYVRIRAIEGASPLLYWSTQRRITCGKLQLAKDLILSVKTPEEHLEWSEVLSNCMSEEEVEKQRNQFSVDTLQFLLFLYIQQLKEWPSPRNRSQSPDLTEKSNCHNKNWNDYSHQAFIYDHLLLDPGQLTASFHSTHSSLVSQEDSLLKPGRSIHFMNLHSGSLVEVLLTGKPFGTSTCLKSGKKLAWAHQVEGTTKRAKIIACNSNVAPGMHHMVVMSQVYKQTLAKSSDTLVGAHVEIHHCSESFKCRNSTFVLGPVATMLYLHSCDNVKVIVVCHHLSISSATGCVFHILMPMCPLILSGSQVVTFAPFHTHYPMLGLATVRNYWNNPMVVCRENSDTSVFWLLPPSELYVFIISFEMEEDTTEIPGGLPFLYQKALGQRELKIQIWQKTVKKQFQVLVKNKFCEWLINTGHHQQLDSLVPPAAGSKQAAG
ncbi:hypothetical protein H8958_011791 [Nasalis larvatus]